MRWFDNSHLDREDTTVVNTQSVVFRCPSLMDADTTGWWATYDPNAEECLKLHFGPTSASRKADKLRRLVCLDTGAVSYALDGEYLSPEELQAVGCFSIPLSNYHIGPGYGRWVVGIGNIVPLEAFLSDRGDTTSAQKIRDTFPKVFEPPTPPAIPISQPTPLPISQSRSRGRWKWPFSSLRS